MQNKKVVIPIIAGSCALITIGAGTLIATQLISKDSNSTKTQASDKKPLNRDEDYEHYEITQNFKSDSFITQIVDKKLNGNEWVKSVNETKFQDYMKNNVRNILKKIPEFENDIDRYKIEVNYSIQDDCKVAFDIVWTPPNEKIHYYDQLQISF